VMLRRLFFWVCVCVCAHALAYVCPYGFFFPYICCLLSLHLSLSQTEC
jgi:hypothetical protein